jgi:hypothetical protein
VMWAALYLRLRRIYLAIRRDPDRLAYTDLAMTPVTDDETQTRELFNTEAAQAFVGQQRHLEEVRRSHTKMLAGHA